ncbi:MAG: DNA polymerase III subunit beta [bacterium]|nr:DNA polymerase III subunit beta [bacterium]
MKFSCTKENLFQALTLTSAIAGKSVNLPILSNVLIKASAQKVEICATNLELAIVVNVRSKVETEGSFTVPARTLSEFVGLLPDERIDLELMENEMSIVCGKSSTKIKGVPAEDFPVIPTAMDGKGYLVSASIFEKGLSQVLSSVARTDIRPELAGVFFGFNLEAGQLVLAATDSYRLAEKKIALLQGAEELKAILPGRAAQEIVHIISALRDGAEKDARVLVGESQFVLNFGNIQMISRLTDGQYPDYTQIIPKNFKTTAELMVQPLIKEIKAASLFTTAGVNSVSLDINSSQGTIGISSTSNQMGEYSSEAVAEITGEENSILLNHKYVLDGLANMGSEKLILKMVGAENPCVFTPAGDESYLYIVMPIRQ